LAIKILSGKSKDASKLADNFWFILQELSKDTSNPLNSRIVDPANTTNILSDLLNATEKKAIISKAKTTIGKKIGAVSYGDGKRTTAGNTGFVSSTTSSKALGQ
jgi:hypothetical protein